MMDIKDIQEQACERGREAGGREVVEERFPMLKGINLGEGVTAEQVVSDLLICADGRYCNECEHCIDYELLGVSDATCKDELMRDAAAVIKALLCGGASGKPRATGAEDTNVPANGGWISVKDRLPEKSKNVLLFPSAGCCCVGYYFESKNKQFTGFYSHCLRIDATHWMPLPEPPKGG